MKTVTFTLENGSKETYKEVEYLLSGLNGIERALIDVNDGDLKIEYNEDVIETEVIKHAIERQGTSIKDER